MISEVPIPDTAQVYVIEADVITYLGICDHPSTSSDANGYVVLYSPLMVTRGAQNTFNLIPVSLLDWVDFIHIRPTAFYLAGEMALKAHGNAHASFKQEYAQARSGIVLPSAASSRDWPTISSKRH